ncbi:MAG TPA: hypothetical protein VLG27_01880 [Candidatus Saccharimonadia bacterium]|nr:hypothetical protein [Candidatus Saccharimonadia bacterium]
MSRFERITGAEIAQRAVAALAVFAALAPAAHASTVETNRHSERPAADITEKNPLVVGAEALAITLAVSGGIIRHRRQRDERSAHERIGFPTERELRKREKTRKRYDDNYS